MVEKTKTVTPPPTGPLDCACVIHSDGYDWSYVTKLYNMLNRNISQGIRLHVYTEPDRPVPSPMIKHELDDWGIGGKRQSWWYKMQLFDTAKFQGPLLYFDLDVVVLKNIDWISQLPLRWFWTVRDFRYLWRPHDYSINSSIMWWDNSRTQHVWHAFKSQKLTDIIKKYKGDQDFLTQFVTPESRRYFNTEAVCSWRWQCKDGGYDFKTRRYYLPNTGSNVSENTHVLIFHGDPKPEKVPDPLVLQHWR